MCYGIKRKKNNTTPQEGEIWDRSFEQNQFCPNRLIVPSHLVTEPKKNTRAWASPRKNWEEFFYNKEIMIDLKSKGKGKGDPDDIVLWLLIIRSVLSQHIWLAIIK